MKKILLLLTSLGTLGAIAQTNTANGTITDCNGDPVIGLPVFIFTDSVGGTWYSNTVYTDSLGFYEDNNITYNTVIAGTQGIFVNLMYAGVYYGQTEFPASAGNIYTNNFSVICDTTTPPAPDSIYGDAFVAGYLYDCLGNPLENYDVYIEMDSTGTGHYAYNIATTGLGGYYFGAVPRMDPSGTPVTINVHAVNPVGTLGMETNSGVSMVVGDTTMINLYMDCPTCTVNFYSYWDSTGVSGNDTIYLYVSYASLNPAATTVAWDFGDGNNATGINTSHEYTSNGIYNICVTVTNPDDSCTATYCDSIAFVTRSATRVIKTLPAASLGVQPSSEETFGFNVFPNPAGNSISIQTNARIRSVRMFDMSGRQVHSHEQPAANGQLNLDIHNLESGMYIMQLFNENNELIHTHNVLKR